MNIEFAEFQITDDGIYIFNGKELDFIFSRVDVLALTYDVSGKNHGLLLQIWGPNGKKHVEHISRIMLADNGAKLIKLLISLGAHIPRQRWIRELMMEYFLSANPGKVMVSVDKSGWVNINDEWTFVFPSDAIGQGTREFYFQSEGQPPQGYELSGTLEDWQENVSALCSGNPYLIMAVSMAFAAPLLRLLDVQSGGINFYGSSSIGKTIMMFVANSVTGSPALVSRCRATDNSLEPTAEAHNDTLMCVDEMGQMNPRLIGEVVYMLAHEEGKRRASSSGGSKNIRSWKLLFMFTSEYSLESHMAVAGQRSTAGQQVRLIDIPVDPNDGSGIVHELHGFPDSRAFVDTLLTNSRKYYGAPIRSFLSALPTGRIGEFQCFMNDQIHNYIAAIIPPDASGQVVRVGERFGLIATAGELATRMGTTGWEKGEAANAAALLFARWIQERGGTGPTENIKILDHVRSLIEKYGNSRFVDLNASPMREQRVSHRWGFRECSRDDDFHYILPKVFWTEFCKGFDRNHVCQVLHEKGLSVNKDSAGNYSRTKRIFGKSTRLYVLQNVLAEEMEVEETAGGDHEEEQQVPTVPCPSAVVRVDGTVEFTN